MSARAASRGRTNVLVWLALMALAAASFGLSFVDLGGATVPVALTIATLKALLVALFFMELLDQRFTNRAVLIAALAFVVLLASLMGADVLTRDPPPLQPAVRY
jgi:cytochrome c oxidase subunit 4